jgi:hypothetical protein
MGPVQAGREVQLRTIIHPPEISIPCQDTLVPALHASRSDLSLDVHGSREQAAVVYHSDGLLPPYQPCAPVPLCLCPRVMVMHLARRPCCPDNLGLPLSPSLSPVFPFSPPLRAGRVARLPLWIGGLSNITEFPRCLPHKPQSAPPIPATARASRLVQTADVDSPVEVPRLWHPFMRLMPTPHHHPSQA